MLEHGDDYLGMKQRSSRCWKRAHLPNERHGSSSSHPSKKHHLEYFCLEKVMFLGNQGKAVQRQLMSTFKVLMEWYQRGYNDCGTNCKSELNSSGWLFRGGVSNPWKVCKQPSCTQQLTCRTKGSHQNGPEYLSVLKQTLNTNQTVF